MEFGSTMNGYFVRKKEILHGFIDNEGFYANSSMSIRLTIKDLEELISFMKEKKEQNNEEQNRQKIIEKYKNVIITLLGTNTLHGQITFDDVFRIGDSAIEFCGLNPWCLNEGRASGEERCGEAFDKLKELKLL